MHILGLILAGGRSTRMGRDKALLPVAGQPLLGHVVARLSPQVDKIVLNANGDPARFTAFHLPIIADHGESRGPASGILAGLAYAQTHGAKWIGLVPVDAPLLPLDLMAQLGAAIGQNDVAMARGTHIEPLFSLWRVDAAPKIAAAVHGGEDALYRIAQSMAHAYVDFACDEGFLNLNDLEDVHQSQDMVARQGRPRTPM